MRRSALALLTFLMLAAPAHAVNVPPALPDHFAIGVKAHPDATGIYGWMPNSGIPFDYAYQYLAGGVNTGNGWQGWNANAQFPLMYAQGAATRGYIPTFPYYQLLQSNGTCATCEEPQRDLSNLNNATVMNAYFADFAKLMQRLGNGTHDGIAGFGGTAIVHLEPDLSGYAHQAVLDNANCYGFCTGTGNDPSLLKAAVASSGHPAVSAFPNTYKGFNQALLHIRDLYAPNVLLAFHFSGWSTMQDVGSSTDPLLDVAAIGAQTGSFVNQAGDFDLLFNDVADRDAAYYKYVWGRNAFWDRTNTTFPNFQRYEQYISAVTQATGLGVIVWQVPVGNQWFRSVNNTDGHYQDNRIEYFFGHLAGLRDAGVIGLQFGAGNAGSTDHWDAKGDGVTNPAAICNTDGNAGASVCNDHVSSSSDDDGGYLRMQSASYFQNPLPLEGGGGGGDPVVSGLSAAPSPFSPNGDGAKDTTSVSYSLSEAGALTVRVVNAGGTVVRTLLDAAPRSGGPGTVVWDGRSDGGVVVADGTYTVRASAGASNAAATVVVDRSAPAKPVVTSPKKTTVSRKSTIGVSGTADAGTLVQLWVDANLNGARDPGEALAGSRQLGGTSTSWSITVNLGLGINHFVATATDAAGNTSAATAVPAITRL
jgi:hypothetical protein